MQSIILLYSGYSQQSKILRNNIPDDLLEQMYPICVDDAKVREIISGYIHEVPSILVVVNGRTIVEKYEGVHAFDFISNLIAQSSYNNEPTLTEEMLYVPSIETPPADDTSYGPDDSWQQQDLNIDDMSYGPSSADDQYKRPQLQTNNLHFVKGEGHDNMAHSSLRTTVAPPPEEISEQNDGNPDNYSDYAGGITRGEVPLKSQNNDVRSKRDQMEKERKAFLDAMDNNNPNQQPQVKKIKQKGKTKDMELIRL